MNEQLSLLGSGASPEPTDRLFFAIFPPPETAARISGLAHALRGTHGLTGKPLPTGRLHVTLHHLGDYVGVPPDIVVRAKAAAATMSGRPFDIGFDRAVSFSGKPSSRPFVLLGGDSLLPLAAFQRTLITALQKVGLGGKTRAPFKPHVTMLYDSQLMAEQAIEPIDWVAHEFVLVHSLLGRTEHIPLGRWALAGYSHS